VKRFVAGSVRRGYSCLHRHWLKIGVFPVEATRDQSDAMVRRYPRRWQSRARVTQMPFEVRSSDPWSASHSTMAPPFRWSGFGEGVRHHPLSQHRLLSRVGRFRLSSGPGYALMVTDQPRRAYGRRPREFWVTARVSGRAAPQLWDVLAHSHWATFVTRHALKDRRIYPCPSASYLPPVHATRPAT